MCNRKELLVGFLYDEIDPVSKRTFERHLATCSDCRDELAQLGATREQIALWAPPDADLGFRIVRGAETPAPAPRSRFFPFSPAWGLAAAALLVFAIGAAIANLDVRYGSDGLLVRTGWNHGAAAQAGVTQVDWKAQAEALDRRLKDLEQSTSARLPVQTVSTSALTDGELLQRVRDIVGQSETRQQRAVATRLTELMREVDAQRRLDMANIDQHMTRLQTSSGVTNNLVQRLWVRAASYDAK